MSSSNPDRTLDLSNATHVESLRFRYDEAWRQAVLTGGPPPVREEFLEEVQAENGDIATELTQIDGAYSRIRELMDRGLVSLSPSPRPAAESTPRVPRTSNPSLPATEYCPPDPAGSASQYAETLDAVVVGRPAEAEPSSGVGSQYAETIESSPPASSSDEPPLVEEGARIGNYELLGIIAHGGMGVVFKARHTRLDRLAAIKMVLAGAHATPDQLARFHSEAQAIARLQHPNIVQLYEVGEHDELPYIALEYVEGGSLEHKSGSKPQPPRETAEQVERLARAMHFAHENGIIHRDLKPANILLTEQGIPKVTDFGLAKRLEGDSSQTRTGTLMGTPSFMAPEQARGDNKAVGPLTDVYSLGAILYHQLTGRPPFAAGSAMETVVAVLKTEPIAPSRLQPNIPRDLETICLKCLEKEPEKRYASAADLADDLHRFLAGEPIRARPVGWIERLWRWARRNRGIAFLSAVVLLLLSTVAAGSTIAAILIRAEKRIAEENAAIALRAREEAERAQSAAETALKHTETARGEAVAAHRAADEFATAASEQRGLALDALEGLVTKVLDRLDDSEGSQRVKKELLELAIGGLKKITGSAEQMAVADMRMADAHRRLGEIARRLGDIPLTRKNYEQVDRIIRHHLTKDPKNPDWKRSLSVANVILGDLALETGDRSTARMRYESARQIRKELAAAENNSRPTRVDLAQAWIKLGDVSEPEEAIRAYREALAVREEILDANPADPAARRDVGLAHFKIADGYRRSRNPKKGHAHAEQAVEIARKLVEDFPSQPRLKVEMALALMKLGDLQTMRNEAGPAAASYEEAIRTVRPQVLKNQKDLVLQLTYALLLARGGKHVEATERAARVARAAPTNAFLLYNAACTFALASSRVSTQLNAEPTKEEKKQITFYQEAALKQLRAAITAGFADREMIHTSTELDPIRSLPEFVKLVESIR